MMDDRIQKLRFLCSRTVQVFDVLMNKVGVDTGNALRQFPLAFDGRRLINDYVDWGAFPCDAQHLLSSKNYA
jgi:hypothetical protein